MMTPQVLQAGCFDSKGEIGTTSYPIEAIVAPSIILENADLLHHILEELYFKNTRSLCSQRLCEISKYPVRMLQRG